MKCELHDIVVRNHYAGEIGKRIEQKRRSLCVAMTRAMERLIITYRKRQMGQPITVASRLLKEIGE